MFCYLVGFIEVYKGALLLLHPLLPSGRGLRIDLPTPSSRRSIAVGRFPAALLRAVPQGDALTNQELLGSEAPKLLGS